MLPEIPREEFGAALDACVDAALDAVDVTEPPIDALEFARRRGLTVAVDARMEGRARFVRLALPSGRSQGAIFVGKNERPERLQWAVAHELGETLAAEVFASLGVKPNEAPPSTRETIANLLANRILVPGPLLAAMGPDAGWDLLALKSRFSTASHELIARRMLDMTPPIFITLFDQGAMQWRRGAHGVTPRAMSAAEEDAWRHVHASGETALASGDIELGIEGVVCWPVHEEGWRREIMRTQLCDVFE